MKVDPHRGCGSLARIMIGAERSNDEAAEIDNEDEQQDFPNERQLSSGSSTSKYPKANPTRNGDRTQNKKWKEKTAIRKKRKEKSWNQSLFVRCARCMNSSL